MQNVILNPLEEYDKNLKHVHSENTNKFFEKLVQDSGVNPEQNRETVKQYNEYEEILKKLNKKLGWLRFLRVLMCLTIILIPLVILKTTPAIRALREEIASGEKRREELLAEAWQQMQALNGLFTDRDALNLVEGVMPLLKFEKNFSLKQEADMILNYNYTESNVEEQSTVEVLAGHYNDNPFLFENKLIHRMGTETYHGSLLISWTETYRDSNGNLRTRTKTQTLHASVTKPKPFYSNQIVLNYCSQGGPDLCFSRTATHYEQKSDKEIEKIVKRGEKDLQKRTDKALKNDSTFMAMSNSEFEVMFGALDRNDEVQYRTLFTPLAQTNLVHMIRSKIGYGDDFNFYKSLRTNRIISGHSQGRVMNLLPQHYVSYSFDEIQRNFVEKNINYFKAVYFDFAPLLAIPIYQDSPASSLQPIPDYAQQYSIKQSEVLANCMDYAHVVHPNTKTKAILKSAFVSSDGNVDQTCVTAYSYDIEPRVDLIPVRGGDGHWHNVPVHWDEYLPLIAQNNFFVAANETAGERPVLASINGLCIFNS